MATQTPLKISELPDVGPLSGEELLEIVQAGVSSKLPVSMLLTIGPEGKSAYDLAVEAGFEGDESEWLESLRGPDGFVGPQGSQGPQGQQGVPGVVGAQGPSAYQVWRDAGNNGDVATFLAAIKGTKGDQGDIGPEGPIGIQGPQGIQGVRGAMGIGIHVTGTLENVGQLAPANERDEGDTYVIDGHFWTVVEGEWLDLGSVEGPQGDDAYEVAQAAGFSGTKEEWLASLRGTDGIGLRVLGSLNSIADLPVVNRVAGDAYIIQGKMYVWDTVAWSEVGQVGPAGASAFAQAQQTGFVGTLTQWLLSLKGKSAFQIAKDLGQPNTSTEAQWIASLKGNTGNTGPQGLQGLRGEQGPMGAGVQIQGKLDSTDDLPVDGELGEGFLIEGDFWGWTGTEYENLGPVQGPAGAVGPQGPKGDTGEQGLIGPQGEQGEPGLDAYETAVDRGFVGDYAAWLLSLKGATGEQGPRGVPLYIVGTLFDPGDLPNSPDGYSYVIQGNLWTRIAGEWEDMGPFLGPKGDQGETGPQGIQGIQGIQGEIGPQGTVGPRGEQGDPGIQGPKGDTGDEGPLGPVGPKGDTGDTGPKGDTGEVGPVGPEGAQGPKGDTGDQGEVGPKGDQGTGVKIIGSLDSPAELPPVNTAVDGDAYLIAGNLWIFNSTDNAFVDVGPIKGDKGDQGEQGIQGVQGAQGPKGDKGDTGDQGIQGIQGPIGPQGNEGLQGVQGIQGLTGAKGDKGDTGNTGIQGPVGPNGAAFVPKGVLADLAALNALTDMVNGDTWIVDGVAYSYKTPTWVNMGNVVGPQGPQGETGATGDIGPIGPKGDIGETGPQGDQGDLGPGITILGRVANQAALPAGPGTLGQGYMIDLDFWGWTGSAYENLGPIQGPRGERGFKGDVGSTGATGPKGDKGDTGAQGTRWIALNRAPTSVDGVVNDYYINTQDNTYYYKQTTVTWVFLGYLGGGNVYDAPSDDVKRVRLNGGWVELTYPVGEAPTDGGIYIRQNGAWHVLTLAPSDGKSYVRKDGAWVELVFPADAPTDGKYYVKKDGAWVEQPVPTALTRYTLSVAAATATLDLAVRQVFTVNAANPRTLVFANPPGSGQAMVVVVKVLGNVSAINWPSGITWANNTQPVLAATFTNVILFWDGSGWTGSTGASA